MKNITDLFGNREEQYLEEVVIIPYTVGGVPDGTYSLPAGMVWTDFERIAWGQTHTSDGTVYGAVYEVSKEVMSARPTSWAVTDGYNTAVTNYNTGLVATSADTLNVTSRTPTDIRTLYMTGYRKRYSTKNLSKTINVNGGTHIAVSSRYEIDIATELGVEYLDRELIVIAEVYNTIDGIVGWGAPGWIYDTGAGGYGVVANKVGNKIVVQTGNVRVMDSSINTGNPFGTSSSVSSIQCRVQVWKIDQYITVGVNDA